MERIKEYPLNTTEGIDCNGNVIEQYILSTYKEATKSNTYKIICKQFAMVDDSIFY